MKNLLNTVQIKVPSSNYFDHTHDVKLSCNMGEIIPVFCKDTIPGDFWHMNIEALIRMAPMVAPVMHRFDLLFDAFFIPNRLLWPGWEDFITGTSVGGSIPAFPTYSVLHNASNYTSLMDNLGIPNPTQNTSTQDEVVNAMPFAAYQFVFNEYFRDQNLVAEIAYELSNGDNTANVALRQIRRCAWEHDYFTSCLPFAQKGAAVDMPIGEVYLDYDNIAGSGQQVVNENGVVSGASTMTTDATGFLENDFFNTNVFLDPRGTLLVDAGTITEFRRAEAIQKWYEANAVGGTRYIEFNKKHFGVNSSDKRLQRPEYIGGVKKPITISEVLNMTGTDDLPQGNMAGHGVTYANGDTLKYFCEEHGFIMVVMRIRPKTAYQQGLERMWLKTNDAFDYFFPQFAHIGEQAVHNREVYAFTTPPGDVDTFGYLPRYAEYRVSQNRVAGDFRTTLNYWHAGRIFSTQPALNEDFITVPEFVADRIFAVTDPDVQKLYVHLVNHCGAVRRIPKFGTPTI